jgi:hypothetical protein
VSAGWSEGGSRSAFTSPVFPHTAESLIRHWPSLVGRHINSQINPAKTNNTGNNNTDVELEGLSIRLASAYTLSAFSARQLGSEPSKGLENPRSHDCLRAPQLALNGRDMQNQVGLTVVG